MILRKSLSIISIIVGILVLLQSCAIGERVSRQIYHQIPGNLTCFRRLNATHQTGCSTLRSGVVGVVMLLDGTWELDWLLENGLRGPYVIALTPSNLTRGILMKLNTSPKISGVLVLKQPNAHPVNGFSPDLSCPNHNYGIYNTSDNFKEYCSADSPWNSKGTGLLFENFNFPIVLLNQDNDINYIKNKCYETFNKPTGKEERYWPLCAAQIKTPMYAAVDTRTCMRRSQIEASGLLQPMRMCEPLQDQNIYAPLVAANKSEPFSNKSVLVLSTRMDATSMFEGVSPGVETTISSLVSVMAVAEILSKYEEQFREKDKNLFYFLLHGEVFDYIGSSRLMYDMENDEFPQKLNEDVSAQMPLLKSHHISHWLELNQVSMSMNYSQRQTLFLHKDPISTKDAEVDEAVTELKDAINDASKDVDVDIESVAANTPLPPVSLQRVLWADDKVPGVVISNYDKHFLSRFYNSIHDTPVGTEYLDILKEHLEKVVTLTARAVYKLAIGEEPPPEVKANNQTIRELLTCYIYSPNCTMWRRIYFSWLPPHPIPLYVSVKSSRSPSWLLRHLTQNTLAYLTGKETNLSKADCKNKADDQIHHYFWAEREDEDGNKTGVCINSTVHSKVARSPAFDIEDYDYSSGEYSTWTESVWETPSARLFLKPSWKQEATILGVGSTVLVLSFVFTYLVKKRANVLFPQG